MSGPPVGHRLLRGERLGTQKVNECGGCQRDGRARRRGGGGGGRGLVGRHRRGFGIRRRTSRSFALHRCSRRGFVFGIGHRDTRPAALVDGCVLLSIGVDGPDKLGRCGDQRADVPKAFDLAMPRTLHLRALRGADGASGPAPLRAVIVHHTLQLRAHTLVSGQIAGGLQVACRFVLHGASLSVTRIQQTGDGLHNTHNRGRTAATSRYDGVSTSDRNRHELNGRPVRTKHLHQLVMGAESFI
jgi:hypothetical protein